jgi:HK97 gp10 family phage protein
MNDIHQLALDLPKLAEALKLQVAEAMRLTAMDFLQRVIPVTPVDTGYCRANWRVGIDSVNKTVSTPPSGAERRANKGRAWYPMPATVKELSGASLYPRNSIYVTNSVHYLQYLEEGSSAKAPAHFVRTAAKDTANHMNEFIAKAKGP